jgi:pseudouridine synthase
VEPVRLNRYLASAGCGSRRGVEELIVGGRVAVNGEPERSLARRVQPGDVVTVDGRPLAVEETVHLLLHKPSGAVSTARDPQGRPTVTAFADVLERVFPVGRLDRDTTGALLLTNDGDLANLLMHPRHGVEKTYEATVRGDVGDDALAALRDGVELDGRRTLPARVRVLERGSGRTRLEVVLREGRNRQVRRMCEAVGHPVLSLHRPRYASLTVDGLAPGDVRALTPDEVDALRRAARR